MYSIDPNLVCAGVYEIRNTATDDTYIGGSLFVGKRWNSHRTALNACKHRNARLQTDWIAYGEATFTLRLLERVEGQFARFEVARLEAEWVRKRQPTYNIVTPASWRAGWSYTSDGPMITCQR